MKYLFVIIAVVLAAVSLPVWMAMPGSAFDGRVIYWVTDPNPARVEQVQAFEAWQIRNGYVDADDPTRPRVRLKLDTGNSQRDKKVIQGVSGVAGDVMDVYSGADVAYFDAIGILADVSEYAQSMSFGPDQTYPAVVPDLVLTEAGPRRQLAFPCNVNSPMMWVNRTAFREAGMDLPPMRWTLDEFEQMGLRFVEQANVRGGPRHFFANDMPLHLVMRGLGVDRFNETYTATHLRDPRAAEALRLMRRWIYELRLMPSAADRSGMAAGGGYGAADPQVFERGQYALFLNGRYMLIRFRQANIDRVARGDLPLDLSVVEIPHGGFPNTTIAARSAVVYRAGTVEDAALFLAFLASEEYNLQIVDDADGLPPNPAFVGTQQYLRPDEDPSRGIYAVTEHEVHGPFARAALDAAIPFSRSPFVISADADRAESQARDRFLADPPLETSASRALTAAADRIEALIAREVGDRPALRDSYDQALRDQQEIDRLKAAGEPIPADLIANPFYLAYYRATGKLAE